MVVVVSGRIEELRPEVTALMVAHKLPAPDKLVLKTGAKSTTAFYVDAVQALHRRVHAFFLYVQS